MILYLYRYDTFLNNNGGSASWTIDWSKLICLLANEIFLTLLLNEGKQKEGLVGGGGRKEVGREGGNEGREGGRGEMKG